MGAHALALSAPAPATRDGAANDTAGAALAALRFFTCGSVDDGKSTLIGRLLHEAGAVPDDQMAALEGDSRRFGTQGGGLDFALLVDGLSAEREQGITIDVAYRYFATANRSFIVADTPGHEQYTRNMATGASTADLAVILVDARLGLLPQTRRHSFIVSLVGIRSVVLAVNKMDLVGYDEAVFRRIVAEYGAVAATLGFGDVTAIPLSARDGDNVASASANMPWYGGPALLPFLEAALPAERERRGGALLPVQWVNRPHADFRGFSGTLARGTFARGDKVAALPSGRTSTVTRILGPSGDLARAQAGQPVTVVLADPLDVSRGDVLAAEGERPAPRRQLTARLLWTGEAELRRETGYVLKLASATAQASITALHHAIDLGTLSPAPAMRLASNDIGHVTLALDRPLVALPFTESVVFGGFILIDRTTQETVALGFVEEGPAEAAAARPAVDIWRGRLARWLGPPNSSARAFRMGQIGAHLAASVGLGLVILLLTARPVLALGLALADLLLRPLAILGFKKAALARWRRARMGGENVDGGGI